MLRLQTSTLRFLVEGNGEQTLSFGVGSGKGELEWALSYNGTDVGRGQGEGWNVFHNGTVVLTDLTGSLSITRYDYFVVNADLPFYEQHSIAIITAIIIAITVVIAIVIKVKTREAPKESQSVKNASADHPWLSITEKIGRTEDVI